MYEAQQRVQPVQPVPPVSPTPTLPPVGPGPTGPYVYTKTQVSGPEAVLAAARAARQELGNQLERLEERRRELSQEMRRVAEGINREGMERRISAVDQRIAEVEK